MQSDRSSHIKSLNIITSAKSLFPYKVTFVDSGDWHLMPPGGLHSACHPAHRRHTVKLPVRRDAAGRGAGLSTPSRSSSNFLPPLCPASLILSRPRHLQGEALMQPTFSPLLLISRASRAGQPRPCQQEAREEHTEGPATRPCVALTKCL